MKRYEPPALDYVRELSHAAMRISIEEVRVLLYDLEHTAPLSAEYALTQAFLTWRKQLEQLEKK